MAVEGPQPVHWSPLAGGTIVQYTFVKLSGDNTVVACNGVTDKPLGVAQDGASSGDPVNVCIDGITKLQGDADLTAGKSIGTSADGQAAAYAAADTTKHICGQVLIGNGAAAGLITAAISCSALRTLA
jgi:hypothetical protein